MIPLTRTLALPPLPHKMVVRAERRLLRHVMCDVMEKSEVVATIKAS